MKESRDKGRMIFKREELKWLISDRKVQHEMIKDYYECQLREISRIGSV